MDYTDFMVDRAQHMRPLEYDLSESYNMLVRYLHDMGVLDNVPLATLGPGEILSASDALAAPLRSLVVGGASTQAGTPTPDAPVPILSVDGLALVAAGKNLMPSLHNTEVASGYGITWEFDSQGRFRNKDGSAATSTRVIALFTFSEDIHWPAGDYVFSYASENYGYGQTKGPGLTLVDSDGNTRTIRNGSQSSIPFTLAEGERPLNFNFSTSTGVTYANVWFEPMVRKVGTDADFAPYIGTTVPDLLPEDTDLRSLPDGTKDTLNLSYLRPSTRAGWAWYSRELVKRCDIKLIDGSVTGLVRLWSAYESNVRAYMPDASREILRTTNKDTLLCDTFPTAAFTTFDAASIDYKVAPYYDTYGPFFQIPDTSLTSDALVNAWFAAHPTTLQYVLTTPVTTTLEPIELPTLPAPTATVWCDGGSATPQLTAEYIRNLSVSIADMQAAIADIISG